MPGADEYDQTWTGRDPTPGRRLNNWLATAPPTATDDASALYEVGSRWIDTTTGKVYTCVDATTGDAVWTEGGSGGGGVTDHGALTGLVPDDDHTQYALGYSQAASPGTPPHAAALWIDTDEDPPPGGGGGVHAIDGADHTGTLADSQIPAGIARDSEVTSAIAVHAGLADPHPGYLTPAEGAAAYEAAGAVSGHAGAADPHPTYAADADLTAHGAAADPHPGYLTPAEGAAAYEATGAVATHAAAANPHTGYATDGDLTTHAATTHGVPSGVIVMWAGLLSAIPSGWRLCDGTGGAPDLRSKFIKGTAAGIDPGGTGGALTHGHTVTQPANHAALTHSAHAGATVADHTTILNHVHVERLQGGTTGTTTGTHLMGSAATGGSLRDAGQSTQNPTSVGAATMPHTVGQASAHSDHAAQSHSGAAVDTVNQEPPYYALAFIQKV